MSPLRSTLSPRRLSFAFAAMFVVVVGLHSLCMLLNTKDQIDPFTISDYWPLSVFFFRRPMWLDWGLAGLTLLSYAALRRRLQSVPSFFWLWAAAMLLTVLANLTQGWHWGLDYPTAGWGEGGIEYYNDALAIMDKGPLWFLQRFHDLQPVLLVHAITHPPGPILLYWALAKLFVHPIAISLAVAALALGLNLSAWRRLLDLAGIDPKRKPGLTLLFAVLPSVSIYYLAVMDAVLAGLMAWALVGFLEEDRRSLVIGALALVGASLLSFGVTFLGPVFLGLLLWRRRGAARLGVLAGTVAVALGLLWLGTGFNYMKAFAVASKLENEGGFLLFANPRNYVWYRLGAVLEIAIYLSPFLCLQVGQGLRASKPLVRQLFWLGTATVAAMLLSGAMKIGEAARICLFLVPYLMLPVAVRLSEPDADDAGRLRLTDAVFAFGLAMQLMGNYEW